MRNLLNVTLAGLLLTGCGNDSAPATQRQIQDYNIVHVHMASIEEVVVATAPIRKEFEKFLDESHKPTIMVHKRNSRMIIAGMYIGEDNNHPYDTCVECQPYSNERLKELGIENLPVIWDYLHTPQQENVGPRLRDP